MAFPVLFNPSALLSFSTIGSQGFVCPPPPVVGTKGPGHEPIRTIPFCHLGGRPAGAGLRVRAVLRQPEQGERAGEDHPQAGIIARQMGANDDDIWRIKAWTEAWVQRLGFMQTDEEALWSTEMEIEAQHYFQPIFERLRIEPDEPKHDNHIDHDRFGYGRRQLHDEDRLPRDELGERAADRRPDAPRPPPLRRISRLINLDPRFLPPGSPCRPARPKEHR